MSDDVLTAQAALSARIPPMGGDTPPPIPPITAEDIEEFKNKQNPNKSTEKSGRGEVVSKPLHLDMEITMLFALILFFSVLLAFVLGFFVGVLVKTRQPVKEIVYEHRVEQVEHNLSAQPTPMPGPMPAPVLIKKVPASSVMKYHKPQEVRQRKEQEELDRELVKIIERDRNQPNTSAPYAV